MPKILGKLEHKTIVSNNQFAYLIVLAKAPAKKNNFQTHQGYKDGAHFRYFEKRKLTEGHQCLLRRKAPFGEPCVFDLDYYFKGIESSWNKILNPFIL